MNEQQRLLGIADLTSRLTHFGVSVVGHNHEVRHAIVFANLKIGRPHMRPGLWKPSM